MRHLVRTSARYCLLTLGLIAAAAISASPGHASADTDQSKALAQLDRHCIWLDTRTLAITPANTGRQGAWTIARLAP